MTINELKNPYQIRICPVMLCQFQKLDGIKRTVIGTWRIRLRKARKALKVIGFMPFYIVMKVIWLMLGIGTGAPISWLQREQFKRNGNSWYRL